MARTAVIAGTATAVSGAVASRQAGASQPQPGAAPPDDPTDVLAQLERLSALRSSGALSEEEFAVQKARILS